MKKFLLTIVAAVAMIGAANAQGLMVGGSITYNHVGPDRYDGDIVAGATGTSYFEIAPTAFFFLNENIAVGGSLGVSFDKMRPYDGAGKLSDKDVETTFMFNIRPSVRYYFINSEKFGVFGQGRVNVGIGSYTNDQDGAAQIDESYFNWGVDVTPGVAYNFNENWTAELTLNNIFEFAHRSTTDNAANAKAATTHNTNFNVNPFDVFNGGRLSLSVFYRF